MKKNMTVLTIVLFFVGSIGLGHNFVVNAMEWDEKMESADSFAPDGFTKKMKDSMIRQPVAEPDLTQQDKLVKEKIEKKIKETVASAPAPATAAAPNPKPVPKQAPVGYTSEDLKWLSQIIHAEAKGEPLKGKIAVGAVVLNRVEHEEFPKSVYQVIHQRTKKGKYQFQPVANGKINNRPNPESVEAAKLALKGNDPTNGALFFFNPKLSRSSWMANLPKKAQIGNHVFAGS
ncbi:cell wall hydrolase [Ammoniphilus sp. 3BR4]|uniref:cell wall hydrolase n=1 Tax=Ammoniphilus sp. 3BR4 TaxID=3158265 RepID=UPI00346503AE